MLNFNFIRQFLVVSSLALIAMFAAAVPATAGSPGKVEAVLAPAWLVRDGKSQALAPGTDMKNGDVIKTGNGSRAYLMLTEGSRVKLGEAARFEFFDSSVEPQGVYRGVFNVAAGAFRFTTGLLHKARGREVTIRTASATIGIRGTDVWGRTTPDNDLVALIEGKIELSRSGQIVNLQPMNLMAARRGESGHVQPFDFEMFQMLAAETEIAGGGAVRESGAWMLVNEEISDQTQALIVFDRLQEAGYATKIRPSRNSTGGGDNWIYSLRIGGFATAEEAGQIASHIKKATGTQLTPRKQGKS